MGWWNQLKAEIGGGTCCIHVLKVSVSLRHGRRQIRTCDCRILVDMALETPHFLLETPDCGHQANDI